MANNGDEVTLATLNLELVKLNTRWRVATSLISLGLLAVSAYGQIKLQELQASVIGTEVLKSEVASLKSTIDDIKEDSAYTRDLLNQIIMDKLPRK